ncbi:hypothetical protein AMTR_s00112p00107200 [Amborella trichopoda]|uniref:Uncharacterized protein n=1 Tax=Amborella trichopoda TaxID=13333 RepID=W1NZI9_AMBTC|nr:hypothetical protein AMTR_s00112p00107200 [Amborella trichopoda]
MKPSLRQRISKRLKDASWRYLQIAESGFLKRPPKSTYGNSLSKLKAALNRLARPGIRARCINRASNPYYSNSYQLDHQKTPSTETAANSQTCLTNGSMA